MMIRLQILARGCPRTGPNALHTDHRRYDAIQRRRGPVRSPSRSASAFARDCPDEPDQFTSHGGDGDLAALLARLGQAAISTMQPQLCLPSDILCRLGRISPIGSLPLSDFGSQPVEPRRLEQQGPNVRGPCLRDAARPCRPAAGVFPWHKAEVAYELSGTGEAREVAHLSGHCGGDYQAHATQRAEVSHHRRQAPLRQKHLDLSVDLRAAGHGLLFFYDIALQCELLRGMSKLKVCKPCPMCPTPSFALVIAAVLQKIATDPLPGLADLVGRDPPSPDQILHRLVHFVGRPDVGQLSGAVKTCERNCIFGCRSSADDASRSPASSKVPSHGSRYPSN